MSNQEYAEQCLDIICNEHIDNQRAILEILKQLIEENWESNNDAAMGDYSFGV
jgi:hypothetical protein